MVITFENVSFEYSTKKILDNASFSITDNEKIGVVGINGTGKTTLIKLIEGIEEPSSGTILKSGGIVINTLKQNPVFDNSMSILDIVLSKSTLEHPIDSYEAKSILSKFGFKDYNITPKNFSGGELKRLALASIILPYSDLLILDEPTNHLDIESIVYLEKYLMKYKHSILLVTHDRYFLERICNKMLEIDYGKTYMYDANYDLFLELKAERLEREESTKRKVLNLLRREREWIKRGAEARSTKQKARIERYEELSEIKFVNRENDMKFDSLSTRLGKKLIELKDASKSFENKVLFENFSFTLKRNDIIGVTGDNGQGKSTLFKILYGIEKLSSGELIKGETIKIGYLSQHLELINPDTRIIDYIEEEKKMIETSDGLITASQLLEKFLFNRYDQYNMVKTLSGGEKRRLQLVKVLSNNPNILLLDEPTNDLDIYTLEILEDYLLSFNGPILVISHDRYFLDKIVNKLFIFNDKKIIESNMMFSEYLNSRSEYSKEETKESSRLEYQRNKEIQKEINAKKKEYKKLEDEISRLEEVVSSLKNDLSYETTDYIKMMKIQEEIDKATLELESKIERYLELEELLKNS